MLCSGGNQRNMAMHPCQRKTGWPFFSPLLIILQAFLTTKVQKWTVIIKTPQKVCSLQGHSIRAILGRPGEGSSLRYHSWEHRGLLLYPGALSHVHKMLDSLRDFSIFKSWVALSNHSPSMGLYDISIGWVLLTAFWEKMPRLLRGKHFYDPFTPLCLLLLS